MNKKIIFLILVGTAVVVGGIAVAYEKMQGDSVGDTYSELASCIANSGAKFYGAFWCSHCQNQKRAFGSAASALPYVECSNPNGDQVQECTDAGISGYPTWRFADGSQKEGEVSLAELAQRTGCSMPVTAAE